MKRLSELIPASGGLFAALAAAQGVTLPWEDSDVTAAELDLAFYYRNGLKVASPLALSFSTDEEEYTTAQIEAAALMMLHVFGQQWTNLWKSYVADYNPINNYDMREDETPAGVTITETPPGTTDTTSGASNVYGFNSTQPSPDGTASGSVVRTVQTAGTTVSTTQTNRVLTRSGNIGVMTPADMIKAEIGLWKWNYFDSVFADICKYLAIPIY